MKPGVEDSDGRTEAERWLGIAEKLLAASDLIGSKRFAERALESAPLCPDDRADQIIAVADVLLASQKRVNNHFDWYSILQLNSSANLNSSAISLNYRRLALLLNPNRNTLPFAFNALKLVSDAYSVLSDPNKKSLFDSELQIAVANSQLKPDPPAGPAFWTACPSCCHVYQYERVYVGLTLRCQKCRMAFRATELAAVPPIVEGTDMYYCSWGFFPLGFGGMKQSQPSIQREEEGPPEKKEMAPVNKKVVAKKKVGSGLNKRVFGSEVEKRNVRIDINEQVDDEAVEVQIL